MLALAWREGLLEESLNIGQWGLVAELVLQGMLQSSFDLQLSQIEVGFAVVEVRRDDQSFRGACAGVRLVAGCGLLELLGDEGLCRCDRFEAGLSASLASCLNERRQFAVIVDSRSTRVGELGDFHVAKGQLFIDRQTLQDVLLGYYFQCEAQYADLENAKADGAGSQF